MNYTLVYGLFNTVPTATVSAYFFYFIVGNTDITTTSTNHYIH